MPHGKTADGHESTATATESEQLKWWLRGFGRDLLPVSPANHLDS